MNAHPSIITILLLLCLTLAAAPAAGAESAQALLNRGNKLFAAGDYPGALEAFKKGHEASPSPFFLRSIGYSYLKMYQHEKAREALQEYLKKYPKQTDVKKVQELVGGLEVVVQTKVTVTSTPPGADLFIDTEAAGKVATTPFAGTIEPGKHTLILRAPGFHPTVRPFSIGPKQALKLDVPLEATLAITSEPSGADVHLDSEQSPSLGKTPLTTGITPGQHKIIVRLAGYKTKVESRQVKPPEAVKLAFALDLGIRVESTPSGAKVEIDGREVGVTPLEESLRPGRYKVKLTLAGYKSHVEEAQVAVNTDNTVRARLQGGLLTMRADLPGAKVLVDGKELGTTPETEKMTVPLGKREIALTHPDRRSWSSSIDFDEAQMVEAEVKLGGPKWPLWVAGGATLLGIVMASVGGAMMFKSVNETTSDGKPVNSVNDNGSCASGDCSFKWHHVNTVGWILAGTGLGTGLLYYFIWGRPRGEVRKVPITTAKQPGRTALRPATKAVH